MLGGAIVLLVLVLLLVGAMPTWGHSRGWGDTTPAVFSDLSSSSSLFYLFWAGYKINLFSEAFADS